MKIDNNKRRRLGALLAGLVLAITAGVLISAPAVQAEYGDVVMNNYSNAANMRPVVFPHWFHRVRFSCKACHADLGIKFKAGGNEINMVKIIDGQFCGACHNGAVAWSVENCDLCHSAKPGTPTQLHESTINLLGGPSAAPTGASRASPAAAKPATAGNK